MMTLRAEPSERASRVSGGKSFTPTAHAGGSLRQRPADPTALIFRGDEFAFRVPDQVPGLRSGRRRPQPVNEAGTKDQAGNAGQGAEVRAAVAAADEEKNVRQAPVGRAERDARGRPATGDHRFAERR